MKISLPPVEKSLRLFESSKKILPGSTQTFAKGPHNYVLGISPIFAQSGQGAHLTDLDGNQFLDLSMAIGPLSLGYSDTRVNQAIKDQLEKGITFSLPSDLEVSVAQSVIRMVPGVESVRFSKTGADVTSAAIRLARAVTKREKVLCCGYHGWHDWYIGLTPRGAGVPTSTVRQVKNFHYNQIDSLRSLIDKETACVILEPVLFEAPNEHFLSEVRKVCDEWGALLIFDEMWTGFRISPGGAQEYFDVQADLITFSKAIANGMPLSVLCGKYEMMKRFEEDVFFYTTFGGEALSLAAAQKTLEIIETEKVCEHISTLGSFLQKQLNETLEKLELEHIQCVGLPFRTMLQVKGEQALLEKSFISQEFLRRKVLWCGNHHLSFSHQESDIHFVLEVYQEILEELREIKHQGKLESSLLGEPMQVPFRTITGSTRQDKK